MVAKKNPFLIYGYESPEYFCDRQEETRGIVSAIDNGRNITLMSARRMGKTGLIQNAFYYIRQVRPEVRCFYLDIFSTNNLKEFTMLLAQSVLGQLDNTSEKWISRITEFFKSCRPVVTTDSITGALSVRLDFLPDNTESTLREIFAYIKESGKECVIAIDEFQQVNEYPEKGTEALLRSFIQFIPNAHFIFSGSKRHLMSEMFSSPRRPFYQSTQKMNIGPIDRGLYLEFAQHHLADKGITIDREVFGHFYDILQGHTWYVQRVLNKVYEVCAGTVTLADIDTVMDTIIGEEEYNYSREYSLLTANQQKLLKAVAAEGTAGSINSKDFVRRHCLGATSSVNRAMEYLVDNEFVIDEAVGYQIYDRFFAIWLQRALP